MLELDSATASWSHRSSPAVVPASGGGGTRKSLPEEMNQVFQAPALGSICWARAGMAQAIIARPADRWRGFIQNLLFELRLESRGRSVRLWLNSQRARPEYSTSLDGHPERHHPDAGRWPRCEVVSAMAVLWRYHLR